MKKSSSITAAILAALTAIAAFFSQLQPILDGISGEEEQEEQAPGAMNLNLSVNQSNDASQHVDATGE